MRDLLDRVFGPDDPDLPVPINLPTFQADFAYLFGHDAKVPLGWVAPVWTDRAASEQAVAARAPHVIID